jgi:hypothetical protein
MCINTLFGASFALLGGKRSRGQMPSQTKSTHIFNDGPRAAAELTSGLRTSDSTIAFIICDAQANYETIMGTVAKRLSCPVVGVTTLSFPLAEPDDEIAARLVMIRRPELLTSVAAGGPFSPAMAEPQMEGLFNRCMAGFAGTPKMFILLLSPWDGGMDGRLIAELCRLAGNIPIFGGVPSADPETDRAAVFMGGQCLHEGAVLIALGGDIRPVFAVGAQLTVDDERTATVTQSTGAEVYTIDGIPFTAWLRRLGMVQGQGTDEEKYYDLFHHGPLPIRLQGKMPYEDGIPELTALMGVNLQHNSGIFTAAVPVGAQVSIGNLLKTDIMASANCCLDDLLYRTANGRRAGYKYRILFAVSCATRHLAQLGGKNYEGSMLARRIPPALLASAFYGFGEICPTGGEGGGAHNRTFGNSIVMCAI